MTSAFSWQNSISLCPASFHIPRPNFPVTYKRQYMNSFIRYEKIAKSIESGGRLAVARGLRKASMENDFSWVHFFQG